MSVITAAEARQQGLKRYFTGRTCRHGHVAQRLVYNNDCVECIKGRDARYTRSGARARALRAHYAKNREQRLAGSRRWQAANPERWAEVQRKSDGLPDPTRPMPECCEICGRKPKDTKTLALDHCHATGLFRGWICRPCNSGLGMLGDDLDRVLKAAAYLQKFKASTDGSN